MKKLAFIIISLAVLVLSACGGQQKQHYSSGSIKYHTVNMNTDKDKVLWVNADGTDCDLGDWLEGDKDCKKTKKTVYYSTPKKSIVSKLKSKIKPTAKTTIPKVSTVKPKITVPTKPKATPKKTVTYKRTTPKTSSFSKPKTTTKSFSSTSRKRR